MSKINGIEYYINEEVVLLEELEKEVQALQDDINKRISNFISNHKLNRNIKILVFDLSFDKLSDEEKLNRFSAVEEETFLHETEFIIIKPEIVYDKRNGEYTGRNFILNK